MLLVVVAVLLLAVADALLQLLLRQAVGCKTLLCSACRRAVRSLCLHE
jgi:hypothetical protein